MARKNYVVFDNYDNYDFDKFKEELEEASDEEVCNCIAEVMAEDWDTAKWLLEDDLGDSYLLVVGTVGLWRGNFPAGKICKDLDEVFQGTLSDCDYKKVWMDIFI